ncbi:M1 family metallopeptidase [Thiocapsa marina]|uniref:Peptidase M28 n=1 Tax=Thiocapsa marina 5811 TaxID=768671 RepID=F9UEN4_9GAMM|nr:M1 family aminopeptidase [Thiocapsa marina]EGV17355.1 peptidase M28 [Thiocapsa marina 5811]
MRNRFVSSLLLTFSTLLGSTHVAAAAPLVAHDLDARIDPDAGTLQVRDTLTFPDARPDWLLLLHAGMEPEVASGNARIDVAERLEHLTGYRLRITGPGPVTLAYEGSIRHAREQIAEGMGRAREWSRGTISSEGVFLDGNSGWYPRIPDSLQTFSLAVTLPQGWTAVSQGEGPGDPTSGLSTWREPHPQDDIYLIAAPFKRYVEQVQAGDTAFEAQVYLREADAGLAQGYLDATERYINLYSELIGDYPFAKFALVENFWETGYGMPSFTLLGPQVIRLPFIVHTSYPHEILHNWWGNGVYVDYAAGNWAEGLTTYLADHLLREAVGEGWVYRREMLKGYADYVRDSSDFPVVDFRGRHGAASQAIGYGKSAMLFHMLRRQLGDEAFKAGLARVWTDNRFRVAGFADLRRSFEAASGRDLGDFFATWTTRIGAPRLRLSEVAVVPADAGAAEGFELTGRIEQTQGGEPFPVRVPVIVHQETGDPISLVVEVGGPSADFKVRLPSAPIRVAVDPWFDVFRELLPGETPVALSNLFGSERGLMILPAGAPEALKDGYRGLAEAWKTGHPGWEIRWDDTLTSLPDDRAVWLMGWESRWIDRFAQLAQGVALEPEQRRLRLGDEDRLDGTQVSPVLTAWQDRQPLGWLAASDPAALPGIARKLPHYGKYSYLIFSGSAPDNQVKGQWPSGDSVLASWLGPRRALAPVAEPPALVP